MGSVEDQVNKEIAFFKSNVAEYESLFNKLNTGSGGDLSQANIEYLLALKSELLAESQKILSNINTIDNSQTNAPGITNPSTASSLMQNKGDIYELIALMESTDLKEQLQIRSNLQGSLEDSKMRYDSINIQYLMYTFIAVIAISLLVNALINKDGSSMGDIILILICVAAIYYGGKYVYDKYM